MPVVESPLLGQGGVALGAGGVANGDSTRQAGAPWAVWRRLRGEHGFTLIELMITLAVVAILAAIAYPSYQDSVRKSRRADAKSVVLNAAQWMERFYTANNRYDQDRGGTAVALPAGLTQAPVEGGTKYYNISLTDCTGAATVTAHIVYPPRGSNRWQRSGQRPMRRLNPDQHRG